MDLSSVRRVRARALFPVLSRRPGCAFLNASQNWSSVVISQVPLIISRLAFPATTCLAKCQIYDRRDIRLLRTVDGRVKED